MFTTGGRHFNKGLPEQNIRPSDSVLYRESPGSRSAVRLHVCVALMPFCFNQDLYCTDYWFIESNVRHVKTGAINSYKLTSLISNECIPTYLYLVL